MSKITLFLGAGFSAPYGLPTMGQFLRDCAQSSRISKEDRRLMADLQLDSRRGNAFLESSPTNIEDILTHALMGDRLKLSGEGLPSGPRIQGILQRIYSEAKEPKQYWDDFEKMNRMLGFKVADRAKDVSFITTNYDLVLESALHYAGIPTGLPFEYQQIETGSISSVGNLYRTGETKLCKLHGSVNWFEDPDSAEKILVEGRIVQVRPLSERSYLPLVCATNHEPPNNSIIVPPSFTKPELNGHLREMWSHAAGMLQEASILVFIGYSFPTSDAEMRYFFARSLAENTNLQRVIIVDTNAKQIVSRMQSGGSGYGSHFREMLEAQEGDWTQVRLHLGDS